MTLLQSFFLVFFVSGSPIEGARGFSTFDACMKQGAYEVLEFRTRHIHTPAYHWCFRSQKENPNDFMDSEPAR